MELDCFDKAEFSGCIFCGGVTDAGEITGHPKLKDAENAGASL